MTILRNTILTLCTAATSLCVTAAPSILTLPDHLNDSTVVYPESFETDTHKMMQN